jgi:hypothetical protein
MLHSEIEYLERREDEKSYRGGTRTYKNYFLKT